MKKEQIFIDAVYKAISDKGQKAKFKRADTEALNHQCWSFLLAHGVDIESNNDREIASLVVASIARSKTEKNGKKPFASALAACYPDGSASDSAVMKMRRICSCDSIPELLGVLRPVLRLIESRVGNIDYVDLYEGLLRFRFEDSRRNIQARWMKAFYSRIECEEA